MDGRADAVLRFALATLFMKQGRANAGPSGVPDHLVVAGNAGAALGPGGASDMSFEPRQSCEDMDVDASEDAAACGEQMSEADAEDPLLEAVVECMGRLRGVCEASGWGEDVGESVEQGFQDAARELREHSARLGSFGDLLSLLVDLLRAAVTEGETMDAASISHVLMHLCFEGPSAPSSEFDEVVEFLVGELNDAHGGGLLEWIVQALDTIEGAVQTIGACQSAAIQSSRLRSPKRVQG